MGWVNGLVQRSGRLWGGEGGLKGVEGSWVGRTLCDIQLIFDGLR